MGMRTRYWIEDKTLIIDLGRQRPILSSAPRGGGFTRARFILNHQVLANPKGLHLGNASARWGDPARDLGKLAGRLGLELQCVGLMTAVALRHLVAVREVRGDLWVEGFLTVGVTNAVRAGEPVARHRARQSPGTINIILVTNARLTASAMVGVIQVATEAKAGALLAAGVPSSSGQGIATGTGTDAVVVACGESPQRHRYSGTHTEIGSMIARVVLRGLARGLQKSKRWRINPTCVS